jgi:hypothetical protein
MVIFYGNLPWYCFITLAPGEFAFGNDISKAMPNIIITSSNVCN